MKAAVIPARGGSKRIPRKNIRPFHGKPMLAWSLEAARASGCFDRILVSTDDPEIAEVAKSLGAEVPFMRPAALADDHAGTVPVMRHATEWLRQEYGLPEAVCCIYATAPFLQAADIRAGLEALQRAGADYALSVTTYAFPVQRALRVDGSGRVEMLHPEHAQTRSQDLEETVHDAAQFYWGRAKAWLEELPVFLSNTVPVRLPRLRVQDIDTPDDWQRAEWLFRHMRETQA